MRKAAGLLTSFMVLGVAFGQAAMTPPKPLPTAVPEVPPFLILTGDETWAAHENAVLFLDARIPFDFARGHIPGSINLPLKSPDFEKRFGDFMVGPKSSPSMPVVVYCSGCCSTDALFLALRLKEAGFKDVRHYKDGFPGWARAERPVSRGSQP